MSKYNSLISTAQALQNRELFAFTSRTLASLFGLDSVQAAHLLARMQAEGLVAQVERGKYLLLGLTPEHVLSNPLFIGYHLATPSYVSFWSALHYHGFTEQVPRMISLAATRRKSDVVFLGASYRFIRIKPEQFFGYRREMHGELPVVIADEAKAIVDSLYFPQHSGGVAEAAKGLRKALDVLEIPILIEYANRMGSLSLGSRLGYLLETLGIISEGLMVSRGPVNLDPKKPRDGEYSARWQIYVNIPQEELYPSGVG